MLQVHANRMCTCIEFFISKMVREIRGYFLPLPKLQLKRVQHKLRRRMIHAPSTCRFHQASRDPEKSLVQHSFVVKRGKLRG